MPTLGCPDLVEVFVHDLQQNPLIQATARLRAPLVTVRSKARSALAVIGLHCRLLFTNLFASPWSTGRDPSCGARPLPGVIWLWCRRVGWFRLRATQSH